MAKDDLTGRRFGRLEAIKRHPDIRAKHGTWICRCECGSMVEKRYGKLVSGHVRSCGCLKSDLTSQRRRMHGESANGGKATKLYHVWCNIRQRTTNPNASMWEYYGERGISVCAEWAEYSAFRNWALANGYADGLTIDRINVNGNYEPGNCRWATSAEQNANKRSNLTFTYKGKTACLAELCREHGQNYARVIARIHKGCTIEQAIEAPLYQRLPTVL